MSIILASSAASFIGLVGYDLLSTTVKRTSQSIIGTVYYLSDTPKYYRDICKTIYHLDLEAKMVIIQSYINELTEKDKAHKAHLKRISSEQSNAEQVIEEEPDDPNECFEKIDQIDAILAGYTKDIDKMTNKSSREAALIYLNQSLHRIDDLLNIIKKKIGEHESRWLKKWRNLNVDKYLGALELEDKILMERLKLIKGWN